MNTFIEILVCALIVGIITAVLACSIMGGSDQMTDSMIAVQTQQENAIETYEAILNY